MNSNKDNMPGKGRPTKYKPEFAIQVKKLCHLGATEKDIAAFFEVDEETITNWKKKHPDFLGALKDGRLLADSEVAHSLFRRATGYSHPDVDIKVIGGKIKITKLIKHYPPDTTACIFWLKNRFKEVWREKQHIQFDPEMATDEQLDKIIESLIEESKNKKK